MAEHLAAVFLNQALVDRLMKYLAREEYDIGDYLMRIGEPSEDLFFIESGILTAFLDFGEGRVMRLRSFGGGTVVGEISMYLKEARTASVLVKWPSVVYRLTADGLRKIETQDPELAAAFHQYIVQLLAQRLAGMNQTLSALTE
jgi:SulP family sulfate permease